MAEQNFANHGDFTRHFILRYAGDAINLIWSFPAVELGFSWDGWRECARAGIGGRFLTRE